MNIFFIFDKGFEYIQNGYKSKGKGKEYSQYDLKKKK